MIEKERIKEFEKLLKRAAGYKTLNMFLDDCDVDPLYIQKILLGFAENAPNDELLEKIADNSDGKVTFEELYSIFETEKTQTNYQANLAIKRGQVWYADLGDVVGSEQAGVRPALIIQNNTGNKYSPTVIVAAITSQLTKANLPTHVFIGQESGLNQPSTVLLEQIRTIDKKRLKWYLGTCPDTKMQEINKAYKISGGVFSVFDEFQEIEQKTQDEEVKSQIFNVKNIMDSFFEFYKKRVLHTNQ